MYLKPRSTQLNENAMLYKRVNTIEYGKTRVFYIDKTATPEISWTYSQELGAFIKQIGTSKDKKMVIQSGFIIKDTKNDQFYKYINQNWEVISKENANVLENSLLNASDIGKYQLNRYIYSGSFNYNIRGKIEEGVGEPIQGLRTPSHALTIVTYDSIRLLAGDLVVINERLYSIESVSITQKRLPRIYTLQHATLNSIL